VSSEIDVAELGIDGRQAPDPTELAAILAALQAMSAADAKPAVLERVPSWKFASRTWGKHAALLRTRPHRPNSF
jgi:Acyl-CoA carboxylase epsilon subunit